MAGHETIGANGWLQGSVVSEDDHSDISTKYGIIIPDGGRLIVATHSCDLRYRSYEFEPTVELFLAEPIHGPVDGGLTHCRNPRRLHLTLQTPKGVLGYELRIAKRHFVSRQLLETIKPESTVSVSATSLRILQNWLVNRYNRTALPNAFNGRITGNKRAWERIRSALKPVGQDLFGIYIALGPPDELPPETPYSAELFALVEADTYRDGAKRKRVEGALQTIRQQLEQCNVRVAEWGVISAAEMPVEQFMGLTQWDFDFISLDERAPGPIPP